MRIDTRKVIQITVHLFYMFTGVVVRGAVKSWLFLVSTRGCKNQLNFQWIFFIHTFIGLFKHCINEWKRFNCWFTKRVYGICHPNKAHRSIRKSTSFIYICLAIIVFELQIVQHCFSILRFDYNNLCVRHTSDLHGSILSFSFSLYVAITAYSGRPQIWGGLFLESVRISVKFELARSICMGKNAIRSRKNTSNFRAIYGVWIFRGHCIAPSHFCTVYSVRRYKHISQIPHRPNPADACTDVAFYV